MYRCFIFILGFITFECSAFTYAQYGDYAQFVNNSSLLISNVIEKRSDLIKIQSLSTVTALGTMFLLKNTINATRPNGGDHSFPSGHTTSAFLGVYPLYKKYGYIAALPAFLIASSVAHSRVQEQYHYSRDVIAGAIIALTSDYLFFNFFRNKTWAFYFGWKNFYLSYNY